MREAKRYTFIAKKDAEIVDAVFDLNGRMMKYYC